MAIGEANGESSTFTIKYTIGYPDRLCGYPVVKHNSVKETLKTAKNEVR